MAEIDISSETLIGRDLTKSVALFGVCVFLTCGSALAIKIEPGGYYGNRLHSASFVGLPLFSFFAGFVLYRLFVPRGAPVRLSRDGFSDLRAGAALIPWDEITNVVRRGQYVSLTLSRKFVKSYPFSLTQRVLKSTRKSARPSHVLVADWCLKTGHMQMLELIQAYREAYSARELQL